MNNKKRKSNNLTTCNNKNTTINLKKILYIQNNHTNIASDTIELDGNHDDKASITCYTGDKDHDIMLQGLIDKYNCNSSATQKKKSTVHDSQSNKISTFIATLNGTEEIVNYDNNKCTFKVKLEKIKEKEETGFVLEENIQINDDNYEFDQVINDKNSYSIDNNNGQNNNDFMYNNVIPNTIVDNTITSSKYYYEKYFLFNNNTSLSKEKHQQHHSIVLSTRVLDSKSDKNNDIDENATNKTAKKKTKNEKISKNYHLNSSHNHNQGLCDLSFHLVDDLFNQLSKIPTGGREKQYKGENENDIKFALELSMIHVKDGHFKIYDLLTSSSTTDASNNVREKNKKHEHRSNSKSDNSLNIKLINATDNSEYNKSFRRSGSNNQLMLVEPQPIRKICFDSYECKHCIQNAMDALSKQQQISSDHDDTNDIGFSSFFVTFRVVIVHAMTSSTRIVPNRITILDMPYYHSKNNAGSFEIRSISIRSMISLLIGDTSSFLKEVVATTSSACKTINNQISLEETPSKTKKPKTITKTKTPNSSKKDNNGNRKNSDINLVLDEDNKPSLHLLKFIVFFQNLFDPRKQDKYQEYHIDISIFTSLKAIIKDYDQYERTQSLLDHINTINNETLLNPSMTEENQSSPLKKVLLSTPPSTTTTAKNDYNHDKVPLSSIYSPSKSKWRKSLEKLSCASPTHIANNNPSSMSSSRKKLIFKEEKDNLIQSLTNKIRKLEEDNLMLINENKQYQLEQQLKQREKEKEDAEILDNIAIHPLLPNALHEHIQSLTMTRKLKSSGNANVFSQKYVNKNVNDETQRDMYQRQEGFPLAVPKQYNMLPYNMLSIDSPNFSFI